MRNSPNFIQVPPKFHRTRIGTDLRQIPPQEHLPTKNWRAPLCKILQIHGSRLVRGVSRLERSRRDVRFEELLIDLVHDGGDQGFEVGGSCLEGFDVI